MTVRHPGISPTNDLVAKKIFSNPVLFRRKPNEILYL